MAGGDLGEKILGLEISHSISEILIFLGKNMRIIINLACSECKRRNYTTTKNKRTTPDKLEFRKYCRFCGHHTLHRESK